MRKASKIGVDFEIFCGVDLVWILGTGEGGLKIHAKSASASGIKSPPFLLEIRARIRATKSEIHGVLPPYLCACSFPGYVWDSQALGLKDSQKMPSALRERVG